MTKGAEKRRYDKATESLKRAGSGHLLRRKRVTEMGPGADCPVQAGKPLFRLRAIPVSATSLAASRKWTFSTYPSIGKYPGVYAFVIDGIVKLVDQDGFRPPHV